MKVLLFFVLVKTLLVTCHGATVWGDAQNANLNTFNYIVKFDYAGLLSSPMAVVSQRYIIGPTDFYDFSGVTRRSRISIADMFAKRDRAGGPEPQIISYINGVARVHPIGTFYTGPSVPFAVYKVCRQVNDPKMSTSDASFFDVRSANSSSALLVYYKGDILKTKTVTSFAASTCTTLLTAMSKTLGTKQGCVIADGNTDALRFMFDSLSAPSYMDQPILSVNGIYSGIPARMFEVATLSTAGPPTFHLTKQYLSEILALIPSGAFRTLEREL